MANNTITIIVSDVEYKALTYVAIDPEEWINNLVHSRADAAKDEIYQQEIIRMTNDPTVTSIPANRDTVVLEANIKTAAQRHQESLEAMAIMQPNIT